MSFARVAARSRLAAGVMAWALMAPGLAGHAQAQEQAQDPALESAEPTVAAAENPAALDDETLKDIIVTGSRVANGNNSPTPLTVVSAEDLLASQPGSIAAGLNTLPGLLGSLSPTSNVNTGGFSTINLRGIGTLRALVLFDGHRVGPTQAGLGTTTSGAVNIDVIPQMLLQRVDVVTGGASAVYGSDAISGVVNFVTDTKFTGFKVLAQNGISRYGDDRKTTLGAAWGARVGDRGHIEFSYEFRDAPGFDRSGRPFFDPIYSEQGSVPGGGAPGTAANPYKLTQGAVLSNLSFGGLINSGPLAGLNFTQNGALTPFVHGVATGTSGVEIGGDGAYYTRSTAGAAQRLHQAFGRFDYDLTDDIHAHAQVAYTDLTQSYTLQNVLLNRVNIGYNNAFLASLQPEYAAIVQEQLAAAPAGTNPSFQFSKMDTVAPNYSVRANLEYWMAAAGLEGDIGNFKWSADYYHTDSGLRLTNLHNVNSARLAAALNAVVDPASGQTVCNAALVNPGVYGSCIPLNVFGPTSENQDAIDYITQVTSSTARYKQDDISATLTGELFDLPAGPVVVALNGEWRKLTYSVSSNATPTDTLDCTGIQFNCTATTAPYLGGSVAIRTPVSQKVTEGAVEADIPILADQPFVEALNLNTAARYTHYNTSGGVWTWKVGATWKVNDAITLRTTRSRDIRAPNLTDLYAAPTLTPSNYLDLHTNTSSVINRVAQGNADLKPEKADTFTAGVVLRPGFLPRFSVAIDYYNIRVNDAIVTIDPLQAATQSACETSGGTSPVCSLYVRPLPFDDRTPANYPTQLLTQALNIASIKTHGVDFEANYSTSLAGQPIALRALVNWQPRLVFDNGPTGIVHVAGAADGLPGSVPIPSLKFVASVDYDVTDQFRVRVQERWRNSLKQNGSETLVYADPKVPAVAYTDLTMTYTISDAVNMSLNIQNLLDKKPPPVGLAGGSTQPNYLAGYAQGDDIEGRYFTVGMRMAF